MFGYDLDLFYPRELTFYLVRQGKLCELFCQMALVYHANYSLLA